jgi:hypothetical protein
MPRAFVLSSAVLFALPAAAQIYRCEAPGGAVTYQQQACEAGESGGAVPIPTQYPDYREARARLAAREAALDARLLKRLEIESAERIARDERVARERELAAERERAAAAGGAGTPVFVGVPFRFHPFARRVPPHFSARHSLPLMR